MDILDLYNLAYDISDEWKQSQEYNAVCESLSKLKSNPDTMIKIKAFETTKAKYAQIEKCGKHHPDFKSISSSFIEAKSDLYSDSLYIQYITNLNEFNSMTGKFSQAIENILKTCLVNQKKNCKTGEK